MVASLFIRKILFARFIYNESLGAFTELLVYAVKYPFAKLFYNAVILRVFFVNDVDSVLSLWHSKFT